MITDNDLSTFWRTIWGEARGEPLIGKIAVAHVILNRTARDPWPSGLADVCQQPWQFSCWNPDDPNRTKLQNATLDRSSARNALTAAVLALSGRVEDPTLGADHYMTKALYDSDRRPEWASKMTMTAVIGRHVFLKS